MHTLTLYCPDPDCRCEWTADMEYERETNYYGLADDADGDCPECGQLGSEERPEFDDEETE